MKQKGKKVFIAEEAVLDNMMSNFLIAIRKSKVGSDSKNVEKDVNKHINQLI